MHVHISSVSGGARAVEQYREAVLEGNLLWALLLVRTLPPDVIVDDMGSTALMYAVRNDSEAVAFALLEAGADVYIRNELYLSALDFAARNGNESMARMLCEYAKDGKKNVELFSCALVRALEAGSDEVATYLLSLGADPLYKVGAKDAVCQLFANARILKRETAEAVFARLAESAGDYGIRKDVLEDLRNTYLVFSSMEEH